MAKHEAPFDHRAIEERAAAWLARRDGGVWTKEDDALLSDWLAESTAHRVAFLRLEAVWEGARRARALSSGPPGLVPPPRKWMESPFFPPLAAETPGVLPHRRSSLRWKIAAAFLLVVGIGSVGYELDWFAPGDVYTTPVGDVAAIPLADGSVVTLNTASRIRVEFAPKERRVILERGEAYFAVKRNAARPFVVVAGDQRIVDVGTQFSVRREAAGLRVVVTEGMVRLETPRAAVHPASGAVFAQPLKSQSLAEIDVPLSAGAVAFAQNGDLLIHRESVRQAEDLMTWRKGYLTFHDTTLADAVAEFNRYNDHQITIEDPQTAAIRISGTFRPTDYQAFVRLLHDGYSVAVHDTRAGMTLSKD
jgi:transmembrane sensor